MHQDNHRFGQSQIFASYADPRHEHLDPWSPPSIRGRVQADWDLTARRPPVTADGLPQFTWSTAARARRVAQGRTPGYVLGAAWLYLRQVDRDALRPWWELEERESTPPAPVLRAGLLHLPVHGIRGVHQAQRIAGQLTDAGERVSVALSPADFAVDGVRAAYARAGHTVVPLGPVDDEAGSDTPRYLVRLRDRFHEHVGVSSNVPRAELLYAAAEGLSVRMLGDAPPDLHPVTLGLRDRLRAFDQAQWTAYADHELGAPAVVPPEELLVLLDWTHHV